MVYPRFHGRLRAPPWTLDGRAWAFAVLSTDVCRLPMDGPGPAMDAVRAMDRAVSGAEEQANGKPM